jgi:hypothetical protein
MTFASYIPEPLDRSRIELTEDYELRFWTSHFACSSQELLDAIEAVGVNALAVSNFIAMRRWCLCAVAHRRHETATVSSTSFPPSSTPIVAMRGAT